jgi:hypothetical protein
MAVTPSTELAVTSSARLDSCNPLQVNFSSCEESHEEMEREVTLSYFEDAPIPPLDFAVQQICHILNIPPTDAASALSSQVCYFTSKCWTVLKPAVEDNEVEQISASEPSESRTLPLKARMKFITQRINQLQLAISSNHHPVLKDCQCTEVLQWPNTEILSFQITVPCSSIAWIQQEKAQIIHHVYDFKRSLYLEVFYRHRRSVSFALSDDLWRYIARFLLPVSWMKIEVQILKTYPFQPLALKLTGNMDLAFRFLYSLSDLLEKSWAPIITLEEILLRGLR